MAMNTVQFQLIVPAFSVSIKNPFMIFSYRTNKGGLKNQVQRFLI